MKKEKNVSKKSSIHRKVQYSAYYSTMLVIYIFTVLHFYIFFHSVNIK